MPMKASSYWWTLKRCLLRQDDKNRNKLSLSCRRRRHLPALYDNLVNVYPDTLYVQESVKNHFLKNQAERNHLERTSHILR